jgi:hypothetical protein
MDISFLLIAHICHDVGGLHAKNGVGCITTRFPVESAVFSSSRKRNVRALLELLCSSNVVGPPD